VGVGHTDNDQGDSRFDSCLELRSYFASSPSNLER
jgi:hypothetical protein